MKTFEELMQLLQPKSDYDQLRKRCRNLWNSYSPEKQDLVFRRIEEKKKRKEFVDFNPLFAIEKNSAPACQQTLTYADYYRQYGTTEEKDGWKRIYLKEQQKTIYVKD